MSDNDFRMFMRLTNLIQVYEMMAATILSFISWTLSDTPTCTVDINISKNVTTQTLVMC